MAYPAVVGPCFAVGAYMGHLVESSDGDRCPARIKDWRLRSPRRGVHAQREDAGMPHPFQLTMKIEGRADGVVRGEFADGECAVLLHYLEQNGQLAQSKPLREGFPCDFSIMWAEGTSLEVETSLPDNDTLSILLHRLRPFILKNEPASFETVSAIIGRRIEDPYLRQLLREQRELYDGRKSRQLFRIASNDVVVNSERVLHDWLNSHEYHRDPDKREAVDALFERMPGDLMRAILVFMLVDKVRAIRYLASLVAVLLGKTESLQFQALHEPTTLGADAGDW